LRNSHANKLVVLLRTQRRRLARRPAHDKRRRAVCDLQIAQLLERAGVDTSFTIEWCRQRRSVS
jgi:hypothetical protein